MTISRLRHRHRAPSSRPDTSIEAAAHLAAARLRLGAARRRRLLQAASVLAAVTAGAAVWATTADLQRTRDRWGTSVTAWVADGPVAPGEPIVAVAEQYPHAMLPPGAATHDPSGALASRGISDGEVVVADDLADVLARAVPPGSVAVAVRAQPAPALAVGDTVVLLGDQRVLAHGTVLAVSSPDVADSIGRATAVITVAVTLEVAPTVAEFARADQVTLALSANPPPTP